MVAWGFNFKITKSKGKAENKLVSYMGIRVPQWIPCCYSCKIVYTVNKVACMKHHFCLYPGCYHTNNFCTQAVTIPTISILYSGCYPTVTIETKHRFYPSFPPVTVEIRTPFLPSTLTHLLALKHFYPLLTLLPTCYHRLSSTHAVTHLLLGNN